MVAEAWKWIYTEGIFLFAGEAGFIRQNFVALQSESLDMDSPLDQYIRSHISPEPPQLRALYRDTNLTTAYPHMCSGHLQGRILTMLTRMIAPRKILELGTFTGYSALCFAEGMPEDAEIYTVEIDDEM